MNWKWDDHKGEINKQKHGLTFETATLVFDDPLAASRRDAYPNEERWQTVGLIGSVGVLVVHTYAEPDPDTGESAPARPQRMKEGPMKKANSKRSTEAQAKELRHSPLYLTIRSTRAPSQSKRIGTVRDAAFFFVPSNSS